ncbi:MAG: peptidoglycan glycosyltransferase [Sphingobacteriales bacterium SCN 48-20]|nr:transpeptidase family protein [Terrimonas ferruginea]ODT95189.1 MAG: peptidoglycan glycosyltransferase [Sphingobacteriales bacterium SCN 48-20]OJW39970.1 MAG: peptidoglycan glycosyltransferase [Sphingobacteriales bacterium 48-107]
MEVRRDILWRVYCCFIGMALLCVFILGKAFYLQGVQGNYWRQMSDSMHQKIVELDADRGTIYSEDGQMLSTSLPQFDIYMDMQADGLREKNGRIFQENIDSFSRAMAGYFGDKSAAQYKTELQVAFRQKKRYFPLRKKMSFEEYKAFRQFPLVKLGRNKSGVIVEENSKRLAPFGLLANRTIGLSREHVASDGKVKKMNVGLEMSYDSLLTGQKGQRLVRFIAGGAVPVEGFQVEPENGRDVYTTIDVNMQDVVQTSLLKVMVQSEALYGTCILMETKTGKIKAIANLGRRPDGTYWEDDNYALRVTEPGSTIKLVTLLAVLEKGTSKLDDMVEVGSAGRMVVGPRNINDAERSPKPVLTVKECFAHSSNVGMGKLAFKAFAQKPEEFREYLHRYHMDVPSPIDLSHLPKPMVAPLQKSHGGVMNMITMSFGYAVQVSPLHTVTLYNAIANDGKMMKPYLVNSIRENGVLVKEFEPQAIEKSIASASSVKAARESMEAVITEGTGKYAFKDMPFKIAGKTGTAHVADGSVKYSDGVYQASFVGYFPADQPQYTCIVVIRSKPHAAVHYGGSLAGPVFREVATKVYAMYVNRKSPTPFVPKRDSSSYFFAGDAGDIKKVLQTLRVPFRDSVNEQTWTNVYGNAGGTGQPVLSVNRVRKELMPNVRGMGLRDALYMLESLGLKVTIKGKGKVISQSVSPGTAINRNLAVVLDLG